MGDVSRRRLILLDGAAALGFALLPQLTLVRPDSGGAPGGLAVSLLSLATALPLAVRRLWPVPVFAIVLTASCVALAAGLGLPSSSPRPTPCTWSRRHGDGSWGGRP
ncbi:hypothetical protein O1M63_23490 [Streptomyces mirabilis]|nr:hypothetical protein [Streptomyces mirabilis]